MPTKLPVLIWDIDGTLLKTGGRGFGSLVSAINEVFQIEVDANYKMTHGMTDYETVNSLLANNNIESNSEKIEKVLNTYSQNLVPIFTAQPPEVLGGIIEVLEHIKDKTSWRLLVGTGNCLFGARVKLTTTGLINYFEEANLFCASSTASERIQIIAKAKESLEDFEMGIVIGDTPADIKCALENNLEVLGLATGVYGVQDLLAQGTDLVLSGGWSLNDFLDKVETALSRTE